MSSPTMVFRTVIKMLRHFIQRLLYSAFHPKVGVQLKVGLCFVRHAGVENITTLNVSVSLLQRNFCSTFMPDMFGIFTSRIIRQGSSLGSVFANSLKSSAPLSSA
jgi:hypothetical protein